MSIIVNNDPVFGPQLPAGMEVRPQQPTFLDGVKVKATDALNQTKAFYKKNEDTIMRIYTIAVLALSTYVAPVPTAAGVLTGILLKDYEDLENFLKKSFNFHPSKPSYACEILLGLSVYVLYFSIPISTSFGAFLGFMVGNGVDKLFPDKSANANS